jgi:hypothetical protein
MGFFSSRLGIAEDVSAAVETLLSAAKVFIFFQTLCGCHRISVVHDASLPC